MLTRLLSGKAVAVLAALALMTVGTVGAGAASGGVGGPGPVNDVLSSLGVIEKTQPGQPEDNHGTKVEEKVHSALESSTPGPNRGQSVSQAACEAAHDRATLPVPAQNAPGQPGTNSADCGKPDSSQSTAASESSSNSANNGGQGSSTQSTNSDQGSANHGEGVSNGVHDAIASSTPGPERGQAVSEAACIAAHNRTTLPSQAQNATGQQDGNPNGCVHPNADGTPGAGNGGGQGSSSSDQAPTQSNSAGQGRPATLPSGPGLNQSGNNPSPGSGRPATLPNVPSQQTGPSLNPSGGSSSQGGSAQPHGSPGQSHRP